MLPFLSSAIFFPCIGSRTITREVVSSAKVARKHHVRAGEKLEIILAKAIDILRLLPVIDFAQGRFFEILEYLKQPQSRVKQVKRPYDSVQNHEIEPNQLVDSALLNLHNDGRPVLEHGPVGLAQARRGQRGRLDRTKGFFHFRLPEFRIENLLYLAKRDRRDAVEQDFKLFRHRLPDKIRTLREDLPELDERRPEACECFCEILPESRVEPRRSSALKSDDVQSLATRCDTERGKAPGHAIT